ncbi:hypothetical protein GE09DRAFT_1090271 [Coniochaeta sp. 2T2.1]|nr:hypothetical protein GE09DRAFT_1090271 [Coniochaeta sp. 2T2.1]
MEGVSPEQAALIRHWSAYGQRGKTPNHRVGPHEWRREPFSAPVTTPWHVPIRPDQLPLLVLGFLPRMSNNTNIYSSGLIGVGDTITTHIFMSASRDPNMTASEDKWFVYADGPDEKGQVRLHAHRSWSGIKMMELRIDAGFDGYGRDGAGASITAITWESDPEKAWKDGDAKTYIEAAREVCSWVLNVQLGPSSESGDLDPGPGARDVVLPTSDTLIAATANVPPVNATVYRRS